MNGYITLVTDDTNGKHSEAFVISSGRDYKMSEHFWIWNVNGLGHYTEFAEAELDDDDKTSDFWSNGKKYTLNVGITIDGAIVANRITVGHMSADRVRTGVLVSQDGNVIWNLNAEATKVNYTDENGTSTTLICPGGSLLINKGKINLGDGMFTVDDDGNLHAEKGNIGGFEITASDIHNDVMTLDSNGLSLYETSNSVRKEKMALNNNGLHLSSSDGYLGHIGTSEWENDSDYKLLAMNLENDAAGIAWSYKENDGDKVYKAKMVYVTQPYEDYDKADTLYVHGNLDLRGFTLKNFQFKPDNGLSGTFLLLKPGAINSDGTINDPTYYTKTVTIQNGIVLSS